MPNADIERRVLAETYPSAVDALGLAGVTAPRSLSTRWIRWDGSVLGTSEPSALGVRIVARDDAGNEVPLSDWLPTSSGQQWGPVAFSDGWLAYADGAGSHTDGPVTAPGLVVLNVETGKSDVITTQEYGAPLPPCDPMLDCHDGDYGHFLSGVIRSGSIFWTDGDPDGFNYARVLHTRPLTGGTTLDLATGEFQFNDSSCVTTPGASVRVSGHLPSEVDSVDPGTYVWDVAADGTMTEVSPPGGARGGAQNILPAMCAGVQVVGRYTPLDGSALPRSMSGGEDSPQTLLNAVEFVGPESRIRVRVDDDFALIDVTSIIRGWAVVRQRWGNGDHDRFVLVDTESGDCYEITGPPGTVALYAAVGNGKLLIELDATPQADSSYYPADADYVASLPG